MRFLWLAAWFFISLSVWAQGTAPQSISFLPLADRPVNSAPFQVVAIASSYLPVTLSVAGPATLNGRVLTLTGPGTVTVSAAQAGNTQYAAAAAQVSFQAQPVSAQIAWAPLPALTYGTPLDASLLQAAASASPVLDASADAATVEPRTGTSSLGDEVPVYGPASPAFRYEGTVLSASTGSNDDGGWVGTVVPAPYGLVYRVGFTCDCSQFEISFQSRGAYYRLWVDGSWTSPDATQDVSSYPAHSFVQVQFPDRRPRQIKFSIDSNAPFFGVSTLPGETISAPEVPLGPSVMIFGDSWTGPTILEPAIGPAQPGLHDGGYPQTLGEYFNWNFWTDGVGGSSFTAPGQDALGRTWVQRLMTDVCNNSATLAQVLIVGTVNDGASAEATTEAAAKAGLSELDSCIPTAPLYFLGPQMPNVNTEPAYAAAAAAYPQNLTYFDMGMQDVLYGSSTDPSTGNAYLYFNGHPTPLGHDFFAEALAADLLAHAPLQIPAPYALFKPVSTPGVITYSAAPGALLPAGSQAVTATFTPADANNFATISATQTLVVSKATTTTTLVLTEQTGTLMFSASVAPQIAGTPTGSVQIQTSSQGQIGTIMLANGQGRLSVPASSLPAGPLAVTASYGGDGNFLPSMGLLAASFVNVIPDFSFSLAAPTEPIPVGATAVVSVAFTPTSGFNQPLVASCTGLPSGSSCMLSGSPVTPSGTGPQTFALQITAPALAASAPQKQLPAPRAPGNAPEIVFGWALAGFLGRPKRARRMVMARSLPVLCLLLAGAGFLCVYDVGADAGTYVVHRAGDAGNTGQSFHRAHGAGHSRDRVGIAHGASEPSTYRAHGFPGTGSRAESLLCSQHASQSSTGMHASCIGLAFRSGAASACGQARPGHGFSEPHHPGQRRPAPLRRVPA